MSDDISKRVISELADLGLPAIPEHYIAWYRYLECADAALTNAIDQRIFADRPITAEFLLNLHDRFCVPKDAVEKEMNSALKSIENEAAGLQGLAMAAASSINSFGVDIEEIGSRIPDHDNSGDLRTIKSDLIGATTKHKVQSDKLKAKIDTVAEEISALRAHLNRIENSMQTDMLTKLYDRKQFYFLLDNCIENARGSQEPLSLIICDIDNFKKLNFRFGHKIGDQALVQMASLIKKAVKGGDFVARMQGNTFAVILPDTPLSAATTVAIRLKDTTAQCRIVRQKTREELGNFSMSIGVSEYVAPEKRDDFLESVFDLMRQAKAQGGGNALIKQAQTQDAVA